MNALGKGIMIASAVASLITSGSLVARATDKAGDEMVHLLAERGASPQSLYERLGFRVVAEVDSFTRPLPLGD